jgi:hypothetical protein
LIVAAPAAVQDQVDPAVEQGTLPVHKMAPAVLAGPCIPRGLSPVALRDPADGLVSVPRGPALAPALVLVLPGPVPVVLVA